MRFVRIVCMRNGWMTARAFSTQYIESDIFLSPTQASRIFGIAALLILCMSHTHAHTRNTIDFHEDGHRKCVAKRREEQKRFEKIYSQTHDIDTLTHKLKMIIFAPVVVVVVDVVVVIARAVSCTKVD